jgi:hypothetical protein
MEDSDFDPTRHLCPDGACVGLIGPDGRCTVCGRTPEAAAAGEEAPEPAAAAASGAAGEPAGESGGFDPNRRLCDDGSCVGLIGADGTCNVCGQKAGG